MVFPNPLWARTMTVSFLDCREAARRAEAEAAVQAEQAAKAAAIAEATACKAAAQNHTVLAARAALAAQQAQACVVLAHAQAKVKVEAGLKMAQGILDTEHAARIQAVAAANAEIERLKALLVEATKPACEPILPGLKLTSNGGFGKGSAAPAHTQEPPSRQQKDSPVAEKVYNKTSNMRGDQEVEVIQIPPCEAGMHAQPEHAAVNAAPAPAEVDNDALVGSGGQKRGEQSDPAPRAPPVSIFAIFQRSNAKEDAYSGDTIVKDNEAMSGNTNSATSGEAGKEGIDPKKEADQRSRGHSGAGRTSDMSVRLVPEVATSQGSTARG